jgi:hypothetical protein
MYYVLLIIKKKMNPTTGRLVKKKSTQTEYFGLPLFPRDGSRYLSVFHLSLGLLSNSL